MRKLRVWLLLLLLGIVGHLAAADITGKLTDAPVPTIPTDRERPLPRPDATYGYSFRIR